MSTHFSVAAFLLYLFCWFILRRRSRNSSSILREKILCADLTPTSMQTPSRVSPGISALFILIASTLLNCMTVKTISAAARPFSLSAEVCSDLVGSSGRVMIVTLSGNPAPKRDQGRSSFFVTFHPDICNSSPRRSVNLLASKSGADPMMTGTPANCLSCSSSSIEKLRLRGNINSSSSRFSRLSFSCSSLASSVFWLASAMALDDSLWNRWSSASLVLLCQSP
jgi:hypothetical protein